MSLASFAPVGIKLCDYATTLVVGVALGLCIQSCAAAPTACKVIDAADKGCVVLKYLDTDGTPKSVTLSGEEAAAFGRQVSAVRAASGVGNAVRP